MSASRPTQVDAGPAVTIPAGQTSAIFTVQGIQDFAVEPPYEIAIRASAEGATAAEKIVTLLDDDYPLLSLHLSQSAVPESAGTEGVFAWVERDRVSPVEQVVWLTNSNPSAVTVPEQVTIPAGQSKVEFPITVLNDTVQDGTQRASLRAEIRLGDLGAVVQSALVHLDVGDDEGPTLELSCEREWLLEGQSTQVRLRRKPGSLASALTVNLSTDLATELQWPATVQLPAGQTTVLFTVLGLNDSVPDGAKRVLITANATGHNPGQLPLVVTDQPLPDLVLKDASGPAQVNTEENFVVSYRIENQGASPTAAPFVQRVLLSKDRSPGDDVLLNQYSFPGTLNAGVGFGRSETVRAPREAGTYWLLMIADAGLAVDEIIESNNTVLFAQHLVVNPAYNATVATSVDRVPANTPIPFTGSARNATGGKVPNVMVNIHIRLGETERVIAAITNSAGDFSTIWRPLPGEGGDYQIRAAHPGVSEAPTQDTFAILTVKTAFPTEVLSFDEASSASFAGQISNPTAYPLTGLAINAVNPPAGLTAQVTLPTNTLAPGQSLQAVGAFSAGASFSGNHTVTFRLSTDQGISLDLPISIAVRPLLPKLVLEPETLKCSVLRGQQEAASFRIKNEGGAASGSIRIALPTVSWIQLASPEDVASIPPGGSAEVTLLLNPSATEALTLYNGTLVVDPAVGASLTLPFAFRVVSGLTGDLLVEVVDESFFFTAAAPKVQGATVTLRDAITAEELRKLDTPANGQVTFSGIQEGWYSVEVDSPNHTRWKGNVFVDAGDSTFRQVFISREWVKYSWKVEEIELQDRYKISVETTFETNVPAPVVTVTPSILDLEDLTVLGQTKVINFTFENHGLINADHANLGFGQHPFYEITPLIENFGTIPAKSSITVPVIVRKVGEFAEDGSVRRLGLVAAKSDKDAERPQAATSVPCHVEGRLVWDYLCGILPVPRWVPIPGSGVRGHCPPGSGGGFGNGTAGPGGPGGTFNGVAVESSTPCDCPSWLNGEICGGGSASISIPNVLSKFAGAVTKVLPLGAKLGPLQASHGVGGKLCICCKDGRFGISGSGEVKFDVRGEITFGPPSAGLPLLALGPWEIEEQELDADLGVTLELAGTITIKLERECHGKFKVCVSGALGLEAFAGASAESSVRATYLPTGEVYEGKTEGKIGVDGFLGVRGEWCNGEPGKIQACASLDLVASLSGSLGRPFAGGASIKRKIELGGKAELVDACWPSSTPQPLAAPRGTLLTTNALSTSDPFAGVGFGPVDFSDGFLSEEQILALPEIRELLPQSDGVCAKVKLRIDQEAVMTRSAFRASLELTNNRADTTLTQVDFDLNIRDTAGNDASELFNLRVSKLSGLGAIDGTGQLGPQATGSAEWTLIPRDTAAPTADTVYTLGGTIRYNQAGTIFSIPVTPTRITVRPDAALYLKYFHQRDVFSDDPHTDPIEPSIPYSLAVMVENKGAGTARNLSITSAQPEIVENEKGLLIDFQIIGTEVAGQNLSPSLTASFSNVQPNERKIGTWLMTSTLQGLFLDYKATFEHLDGFGDPRLSLIKQVEIHEMIHMIEALGAKSDGLPDFLVNDIADIKDYPDTVHLSNGTTAPVRVQEAATVSGAPTANNLTVTLNASLGNGWAYLRVPDPADGSFRLTRVRRSDGLEIPLDKNAWVTDRTFIGLGRRPIRENILHLVDCDSTGQFTLYYEPLAGADTTPPTSQVTALSGQSSQEILVQWSGNDNGEVAFYDVFVSVDSGPFQPWLLETQSTSAIYQGLFGKRYSFYSVATDRSRNRESIPSQADAQTQVALAHSAPSIASISNQSVAEGAVFSLQASASDPEGTAIRFSISSPAPGLIIDEITGLMRWVTGEADGGRSLPVTVTATDFGVPRKTASTSFTLTVTDQNAPPAIDPVAPQVVGVGEILFVDVDAVDSDFPPQAVQFSLRGTVPSGMSINPTSGVISWTPAANHAGQSYAVEVAATDNGNPAATSSILISVSVVLDPDRPPVFQGEIPAVLWLKGKSYVLAVSASDPDGDAVSLSADLSNLVGGLHFSEIAPGSGRFSWPSVDAGSGVYTIPVRASAKGLTASSSLRIRVAEDNLYWNWAAQKFSPANLLSANLTDDPDGDGRSNVQEMAFLTDPLKRDEMDLGGSSVTSGPWMLTDLVFQRRKGSQGFVRIFPLRSPNLQLGSWQAVDDSRWDGIVLSENPSGEAETIRVRVFEYDPTGAVKRMFYRIEASEAQR